MKGEIKIKCDARCRVKNEQQFQSCRIVNERSQKRPDGDAWTWEKEQYIYFRFWIGKKDIKPDRERKTGWYRSDNGITIHQISVPKTLLTVFHNNRWLSLFCILSELLYKIIQFNASFFSSSPVFFQSDACLLSWRCCSKCNLLYIYGIRKNK